MYVDHLKIHTATQKVRDTLQIQKAVCCFPLDVRQAGWKYYSRNVWYSRLLLTTRYTL